MKDENQQEKNKFRSVLNLLTHKKTVKGASITYQVFWNLTLLFLIIIVLGGAFAGGVGAGYFASLVKKEPIRSYDSMKKDIYNYEETSNLYFADKVYLGKLRTDLEREEITLDHVSDHLVKAVIATEDEYFYEHDGVVPKAIMRALFQEVTNSSVQSGGSTLTQQLIKNQILTNEISFERKAKEILLALRLEKFFDKKEILEAYLNVSTFGRNSSGRNIAGVQAASKGLFGVKASELSLPQAAFIAGLPQSPFGYTPFTNKGQLKENLEPGLTRMKTVLKRMYDNGSISEKQYNKALAYDITKDFIPYRPSPQEQYPWLTAEIEQRSIEILSRILAEKDGYTLEDLKKDKSLLEEYETLADRNLRQNGYSIHTTIDKKIYNAMNKVKDEFQFYGSDISEVEEDPETGEDVTVSKPVELGAVLIENKTGKIISFVGGRDHSREQTNHATNAKRPNGSTMKPLLVYAPAIELGTLSPGSILPDVALKLNPASSEPWPKNYGGGYSGLTSARNALKRSYNVPAVKAYVDILDKRPAEYLSKMGFSSLADDDYTNRSTALGGLTNGVSVEENVNAFGTFANSGKFIDAYMIEKIVDKSGKVIYQHEVEPVDVFSPQTSYLAIDMMRDVIRSGTATALNSRLKFSSDWAGKTGTGQDYKDAWFVATNPNVSFGVWMGYDTPKPLQLSYRGLSYGVRNIYIWADLINAAYDIKPELIDPAQGFKMPGGIVRRSFCALSGLLPSDACSKAGLVETDLFNAKYVPTKVDDSFIEGKYVTIGDKKYLALDSTPDEFSQKGLILNPEYIQKIFGVTTDTEQLIPNKDRFANLLLPDDKLEDNGKSPAAVSVKVSGKKLTWSKHSENDVIGYRVYKDGKKVASIKAGETLQYSGDNGLYTVIAVDIAGKESSPSNEVQIGSKQEEDSSDKNNDKKDKDNKEEKPKEPSSDPGTGDDGQDDDPGDGDESENN
ncbi:transglycosylase domain-containing protein [Bacillus sp. 31A1R]|uniref:Transglycosylase domain-containing protein n=1 Tax=Robertmurraya mangrovi TaxID=3098077 RepID=A0ABU5IZK5_9BACI|nr:transglycosylase domain-containing protein [Bacillus sp. 31A1R]MDZ5472540.1 transglycosylase domain-containing protein [Bacillus sp. 31A1R]